jgi:hypothetical protein
MCIRRSANYRTPSPAGNEGFISTQLARTGTGVSDHSISKGISSGATPLSAGRRKVTGSSAETQTWPKYASGMRLWRTLGGRGKCPLASGGRFVGPAWQRPCVDASSQTRQRLAPLRRFGSLRHVNGNASAAERPQPTSANHVNGVATRPAATACLRPI